MVFLNPFYLFALAAAAIPVLLHFLNLRKLKRIEFSSLTFLKELKKSKIRNIKIKQIILLIIRILIVILIVMAFSRPALKNSMASEAAASVTSVILLDDTYSMALNSPAGSAFSQAQAVAKKIAETYKRGDNLYIVKLSGGVFHYSVNKEAAEKIQKDLTDSKVSFNSKGIKRAFKTSLDILRNSTDFNKELVVLSDFSKNLMTASEIRELLEKNKKISGLKTFLFIPEKSEMKNLALNEISSENQIYIKERPVVFKASVDQRGGSNGGSALLSFYINGIRGAQKSLSVSDGNKTEEFTVNLKEAGLLEVKAELEDDALIADNTAYSAVFVPSEIKILLVSKYSRDSEYLKLLLDNAFEPGFINIDEIDAGRLPARDLSLYNAVIICSPEAGSVSENLISYLNSNGSLMVLPGEKTSAKDISEFFGRAGVKLYAEIYNADSGNISSLVFEKTETNHPLFNDIFNNKEKGRIDSPEFFVNFNIKTDYPHVKIITLNNNFPFLSEFNKESGKILFFSSPFNLKASDFPAKSIFAPLIVNSIFYLSSGIKSSNFFFCGDTLNIKSSGGVNSLKILHPDGKEEFVETDKTGFAEFSGTELPGIYKVFEKSGMTDYFVINTDPTESNQIYYSKEEIENISDNFGEKPVFLNLNEDYESKINQARFGEELWKYFILASLIFMLAEMTVARTTKKELENLGND